MSGEIRRRALRERIQAALAEAGRLRKKAELSEERAIKAEWLMAAAIWEQIAQEYLELEKLRLAPA
jgi:hypothetical protein